MGVCLGRVKSRTTSVKSGHSKLFDHVNILSTIKEYVVGNKEILVMLFLLGCFFFSNLGAYKMFMWDEAEYASIARSVLNEGRYSLNNINQTGRLPVYPLSIAFAFALFGVSYEVTKVPGIMFALLSVFAVYFFVGKYVGKKTAIVSAFLLATTPLLFTLTLNTLTDVTFCALFFISAMFFYMGVNENAKHFYLAGIFLGLSFLTRYNAALFSLVALVYLTYLWFKDKRKVYVVLRSKHTYLSLILFFIILTPWMLYIQAETGNVIGGLMDAQSRISGYDVASFPWYYYFVLIPRIMGLPVCLLFVLGIVYVLYERRNFGLYCFVFFMVNFVYFSQFAWKEERMMVSWVPFIVVLSGVGLMKVVFPWLKRDLKNECLSYGVCALFLLVSLYFNYTDVIAPKLEYSTAIGYPSLVQASSFVDGMSNHNESIVGASVPQYFWYTNRITHGYPEDGKGLITLLREKDVSFVLIGNYERNQPPYVISVFSQAFFDEQGQLKYPSDAQEIKVFGDIAHFNDPMRYPVTIVVPADLFIERSRDFIG